MSEWHDMQKKPKTKLRDLLKTKQAKTRRLSELSKIEQNRLAKLNAILDELRRGKNVLFASYKKHYNANISKRCDICVMTD
jgi:hypothetical protein